MKTLPLLHDFRNSMVLVICLTVLPLLSRAQVSGTFTDRRDGHVYHWVKVGTQSWMAENLRFNLPAGSWAYNNDSAHEANFGRLYTWKAAQAACPKGWHLPSDKEWEALIQSLGGSGEAGVKMQSMDTVGKRKVPAGGTTANPVSTLLSGIRHPDGSCIGINYWGGCWSSGKINDTVAINVLFARGTKDMGMSSNDKNSGFSVRCVKK